MTLLAPLSDAAAVSPPASATPGIGSTLLALMMVLGLILALAWILRRLPGLGSFAQRGPGLRIAASAQVGGKERVVVVSDGDRRWLLGVTARQITLIDVLPPIPAATPEAPVDAAAEGFPQLLRRLTGKDRP